MAATPLAGRTENCTGSQQIATSISSQLQRRLGPRKFRMWFGQARLEVEGEQVAVATESRFVADWIAGHFRAELHDVARQALGEGAKIDIRVAPGRNEAAAHPHRPDHAPPRARTRAARGSQRRPASDAPRSRGGALGSMRRLQDFVIGASNRLAHSAARRLIDEDDPTHVSPLAIHGDCGLGKTHLLQGICEAFVRKTGRPAAVRYVTGEQFTNEYIAAVRNQQLDDFRAKYRKLQLLAIDDVHFIADKLRTQSEFLHTIDAIGLKGARVVLASDEHPRHIKRLSRALQSRFMSGMVVQIERPDRETRMLLVRQLTALRGVKISRPAMELLAERCVGSVREMEGAITKLAALHLLMGPAGLAPGPGAAAGGGETGAAGNGSPGEVSLLTTQQLFADQHWQPVNPIRSAAVIDAVCERICVTRADLLGSCRHKRVVIARAAVAYLCRELTKMSFPEIARVLGRTYHSTVHTADQRLRKQIERDESMQLSDGQSQSIRELINQLRHELVAASGRFSPFGASRNGQ